MKRYKKRDLGKINTNPVYEKGKGKEQPLDELVDGDGSFIDGDEKNLAANSEIHSKSTSDEFAQSGIQPNIFPIGSGSTRYSQGTTRASVHGATVENKIAEDLVRKLLKEMIENAK